MKISAVIHTLNEEKNIRGCLECLKWADEIVVIDMYSDDRTTDICREYNASVYNFERTGGYVEPARKFAIEKADGDWILIVDADERVPVSLSEKLKEIAGSDNYDVVEVQFKNHALGKWMEHTGMYPDFHPRFFKKGFVETSESVHGKFRTSGRVLTLDSKDQSNCIIHFGYTDCFQYVEKLNKYTTAEVKKLAASGKKFSKRKMFMAGIYEFRRRYFSKKGYKDGVEGLIISVCRAFYHFLMYAKYYEHISSQNQTAADKYRKIEEDIIAGYRESK
ncbi:MAG TPA: glycosyltransferase family 2 protein [Clostridiales bacterium]|nr:glycosyltransferase family 2 protein [Clostridiales bacterium]